jgi:hypothetical protein
MSEKKDYGLCPNCGSDHLKKNGWRPRATGKVQAYKCRECEHDFITPRPPSETVPMRRTVPTSKRYIITAAQNATPVHEPFFDALEHCAEYYGAELIVVPGRYQNPTSMYSDSVREQEWWDKRVVKYLTKVDINLGERLMLLGDIKVRWAAQNPLASTETLTRDKSGIIGHPRCALKSVATPQHKQPKMMFTTGCCTIKNYTDTKAGKIGAFHHCFGALIVEVEGSRFHVRQMNAMQNGSFIDLDKEFTPNGVKDAGRALSLVMGDTHWINRSLKVERATFGKGGIIETVRPHHLVWHDVLDFYSRNHHHKGQWLTDYKKHLSNLDDVESEVIGTLDYIKDMTGS